MSSSSSGRGEPSIGVIGGLKAYDMLKRRHIAGERIERIDTPFGASQPIYLVGENSNRYYFLSRHGEVAYTIGPHCVNYRANIYAFKELGVKRIISWSAPGALNLKYQVGQFVIVDDIVDETRSREGTFFRFRGIGFIRQDDPFCPTVRNAIRGVLNRLGLEFADRGTYVCTEGPRLETAAEVRRYAAFGGDLVGMTLAPEAFLARELEMCYASLCYVTNYAEGVQERPHVADRTYEGLATRRELKRVTRSFSYLPKITAALVLRLRREKNVCRCRHALQRYKDAGVIGEDWREWLVP